MTDVKKFRTECAHYGPFVVLAFQSVFLAGHFLALSIHGLVVGPEDQDQSMVIAFECGVRGSI